MKTEELITQVVFEAYDLLIQSWQREKANERIPRFNLSDGQFVWLREQRRKSNQVR